MFIFPIDALFHLKLADPVWISDDRGSGAIYDFACYKPKDQGDLSYTVGHFGIGDKPIEFGGDKRSKTDHELSTYQLSVSTGGIHATDVFTKPKNFSMIWSDKGSGGSIPWSIWDVECPKGYGALSDVCVNGHQVPSADVIFCIKDYYLTKEKRVRWIWNDKSSGADVDCAINGGSATHTFSLVAGAANWQDKKIFYKIKDIYLGKYSNISGNENRCESNVILIC